MKAPYSKLRIGVVSILFAMAFVLFFARLVFVQVVRGEEFRDRAKRQYQRSIELPAMRGEIFDIKGDKVAVNTTFKSLFSYPLSNKDMESSYRLLTRIFNENQRSLQKQYRLTPKKFRWIKRGLTPGEFERFQAYNDQSGLFLREEPSRLYPYGNVGQAILGFVDLDNRGKAGIELVMENSLAGSPGRSVIQTNGMGEEYRISEVPIKEATSGQSVVLTVDWDKQQIVEEELARAVEKYKAKGGMAIFLDPHTGAVIAAADCEADSQPSDKPMKLNAVTSTFEPGSIFKIMAAAAALEDGRVKPTDVFYAENGLWRLGRHTLRDDHKYGNLTFREAFEFSSNIAIGKIANEVGGERVFAMAQKFGFGRKVRCGLNGESSGVLQKPNRWSQFMTSTFAIGHGVSVTALQMAQAVAVVASGGYLCQPHFIAGCINAEGHIVERHTSRPIRILDKEVAATLDSFMRGVIERGTGQPIGDAPFIIAGKTGTAEKPNLETGGYNKNQFMASFAGYFPADSPQVAGIVVLDEPEPIHYGGYTAGPAFKNIAVKFAAIDKYDAKLSAPVAADSVVDFPEAGNDECGLVEVPGLLGATRVEAQFQIEKLGLTAAFSGPGDDVIGTRPAAGSRLMAGQEVYCYMKNDKENKIQSPDLTGLTIREAAAIMKRYGLAFTCLGQGRVVRQTPEAGTIMTAGEIMQFECERKQGV